MIFPFLCRPLKLGYHFNHLIILVTKFNNTFANGIEIFLLAFNLEGHLPCHLSIFGALVLNFNVHLHIFFYHYIVVIVPNNFANLFQAFNCEDIYYGEVDYVCALKFIVWIDWPYCTSSFCFRPWMPIYFLVTFELQCHFSLHLSILFVLSHSSSMLGCIFFLTITLLYCICIVVLLQ